MYFSACFLCREGSTVVLCRSEGGLFVPNATEDMSFGERGETSPQPRLPAIQLHNSG